MNTRNVVIIVLVLLLVLTLLFGCNKKEVVPYEGFDNKEEKEKIMEASGNIKEMVDENSDKIEAKLDELKKSVDELKESNKEGFSIRYEGFTSLNNSDDYTCQKCEKCVSGCKCNA